ncbi:hypothetical protein AeMF1_021583 [Aphanomyces euteiches]|nr:hypothetical protein AeMF1_021583 [Aphanomyces euteiches]KAH9196110.1 hypothetical protein AeNC1_001925 [Aphanomyces euteiches]
MEILWSGDVNSDEWTAALNAFCDTYEDPTASFVWKDDQKRESCNKIWTKLQTCKDPLTPDTLTCLRAVKILLRGRDAVDCILSLDAFAVYVHLAETTDSTVANEALKCAINSVYARPDFIELLLSSQLYDRLFKLAQMAQLVDFHLLVWRCLLATFENARAIVYIQETLRGLECILPTILYCIRFEPQRFPTDTKRIALVTELLKALYVLASTWQTTTELPSHITKLTDDAMALLSSILAFPNRPTLFNFKSNAVNLLLMVHHPAWMERFEAHDGVEHLIAFVEYAIMKIRVEKSKSTQVLTPAVIAMHHVVKANRDGFRKVKLAIFHDDDDEVIAPKDPLNKLPMNPPPLTKGSLHESFCSFMTSTDTELKRCVSEFLYTLCRSNATEFTMRTGMGNAVALLRLKGFV